nr:hypothetical protein [Tanacetum cinerariifolium]
MEIRMRGKQVKIVSMIHLKRQRVWNMHWMNKVSTTASMWNETENKEDTILAHKDKGKTTCENPFSVEKNTHVEYYDGGIFVKKTTYTEPMVEKVDENIIHKSFFNVVNGDGVKQNVNSRALEQNTQLNEVMEANERYSNTLYGYFIGKKVAFPIVENYALNVWNKFGLQRTMMNAKGFYPFKFASHQEVMDVITKGFNQDGLSAIATKVGKPIMLDSYTSTMCMESWGRPSYARAMVGISAINELKESITVDTPSLVVGKKRSFASMWNETENGKDTIVAHKDKRKTTCESPFSVEKNTHVECYDRGVFVKKTTYTNQW